MSTTNQVIVTEFAHPLGELVLGVYNNHLCLCDWKYRKKRNQIDERIQNSLNTKFEIGNHPLLKETKTQLQEYFTKKRTHFDLPLLFVGSDFQKTVWNALLEIPYGNASSYKSLSLQLNNPKGIRAIASANGANAISIIVPCHRVIGSNGDLVGYAGGLKAKKQLLKLEGALPKNQLELF